MRYRSPITVPGSKRPWSMPDDSHPDGWVRGWFDGGRTDGVAPWRPWGAAVGLDEDRWAARRMPLASRSAGDRARVGRGCLQDVPRGHGRIVNAILPSRRSPRRPTVSLMAQAVAEPWNATWLKAADIRRTGPRCCPSVRAAHVGDGVCRPWGREKPRGAKVVQAIRISSACCGSSSSCSSKASRWPAQGESSTRNDSPATSCRLTTSRRNRAGPRRSTRVVAEPVTAVEERVASAADAAQSAAGSESGLGHDGHPASAADDGAAPAETSRKSTTKRRKAAS